VLSDVRFQGQSKHSALVARERTAWRALDQVRATKLRRNQSLGVGVVERTLQSTEIAEVF